MSADYHIVDCEGEGCAFCPTVYRDEETAIETAKAHREGEVWVTDVAANKGEAQST